MFTERFSTLYLERRPVGATWITGAPGLRPPLRRSAERDLGGDSCEIIVHCRYAANLIMCIFLFTDSSFPRIL